MVCLCVTERVVQSGGAWWCGWAAAGIQSAALSCIINVKRVELKAEITCHEEQAAAILCETGLPLLYASDLPDHSWLQTSMAAIFWCKHQMRRSQSFLVLLSAPSHPICFLCPQSQSLTVELCTTAKHFNSGCTAALTIQFVSKQLPMWHIWCNCHLVCLNWTMRKEEEWLRSVGCFHI